MALSSSTSSAMSPVQVLEEIISITDIEKNKLSSVTQIQKALAKAREYLPEFEEWKLLTDPYSPRTKPS